MFKRKKDVDTSNMRAGDDSGYSLFKLVIVSGLIGLVLITAVLFYQFPGEDTNDDVAAEMARYREVGFILIILLGPSCFIPLGLILGWIFGDPYQRAKMQRNITKKNYGIVNFVSKGARIMSKIKNFDYDLLFVNDGVWVLESNKVYKIEKDMTTLGNAGHPIRTDHVNNVIGIPTIFLDIDTMRPLTFYKETGDANPIDLAATLKGYVMNQLAKNMFFKRTFTILTLIIIGISLVSVGLAYLTYDIAQKFEDRLPAVDGIIDRLDALMRAAQQPSTINQGGG